MELAIPPLAWIEEASVAWADETSDCSEAPAPRAIIAARSAFPIAWALADSAEMIVWERTVLESEPIVDSSALTWAWIPSDICSAVIPALLQAWAIAWA